MSTAASRDALFRIASDQSLIIYFTPPAKRSGAPAPPLQNQIKIEAHERVRRLLRLLELEPIAGMRNLHPGYGSILIKFDTLKLRHEELEEVLRGYLDRMEKMPLPEPRLVEIPVCYGEDFGPDLNEVARLREISPERVIELHASATYLVYFLGFVPGFAYLGELSEALATPRLPTPRKSVSAGSVGIAGSQTGVYPIATPGGWRLLGRTPVAMFRPERKEMSLLSIGDRVNFVPIPREQFAKLEKA
ncbi:MAG: 5-oxoprolinase subunit PxpB [Candidatus Acidiferrum sp.]